MYSVRYNFNITFPISSGYLVTLCIGLSRKEERGSPPVLLSFRQVCSYSLKVGSWLFDCSRVHAVSWQEHHLMWGVRWGICSTRTSPIDRTIVPEVRNRMNSELYIGEREKDSYVCIVVNSVTCVQYIHIDIHVKEMQELLNFKYKYI